jgi:predicted DCC family thiol-disulfide oxidoreductase YuxK
VKASANRVYNLFSARYWLGQLDLRPLGFMRIAFGAVLFWSTLDLSPVLFDFFSDSGVAPRGALLGSMVRQARFCLYDVAGPPWVLVALYWLTLLSILIFMLGWHSRLASITTFLLVCGIHERNLLVFDGSDNMIRVLLFWLMFMPTGARYSVDAVLRAARGQPLITQASALPIRMGQINIAWVYLDTVLYKWPGVEWHNGSALRIALGLDHLFTRSLGRWMFGQSWFLWLGTHFTVVAETAMLPLVFLPLGRPATGRLSRWPRWLFQPTWKALGLALVTAMHLGIAVLMSIGNFSYVMISSYFLLYEPEWIEAVIRGLKRLWGSGHTQVLYDGDCALCTWLSKVLRGLDVFGNLELINFRDRTALVGIPAGLTKLALDQRLHALDAGGQLRSGWAACMRIARRVPALTPLGLLGEAPGARRLGDRLYDLLANHRKNLTPRPARQSRLERWQQLISPQLQDLGRGLLSAALVVLMAASIWFSFPPDGKIPALVVAGKAVTPTLDVSPSRMWPPLHDAIYGLELWQKWDMFSPKPLDTDMYLEGRGELTDGTQVDVLRGDRGDGSGPLLPPILPGFFFTRWTKYLNNIETEGDNSPWVMEFGRFLCRRWNASPPRGRPALKAFKLYKQYRRVPLVGETPVAWQEAMIWDHHCF